MILLPANVGILGPSAFDPDGGTVDMEKRLTAWSAPPLARITLAEFLASGDRARHRMDELCALNMKVSVCSTCVGPLGSSDCSPDTVAVKPWRTFS